MEKIRQTNSIPSSIKNLGFLLAILILTASGAYVVQAALTFNGSGITSDGALTVAGSGASTWDIGVNTLSLQTTNNGPITTGTGLTTLGGSLAVTGNITSGTWQGSAVGVAYGGTGVATLTANGVLYGNGTNALQATAAGTSGQLLVANATGVPTFVSMSGDATMTNAGVVSVSDFTIASEARGDVLYFDGTNWVRLSAGTNGQYLQTQGAGANPQWATVSSVGISNVVEDTTPQLGGMLDVNGFALGDGTLELLKFTETASAVNEITITNAATGNKPIIAATGDNATVGLDIQTKGAADLLLTPGAATSTVNVITGNLKVGNGTPGNTLDGEDAYIEGTLEVDGASQFDSTVTLGAGAKITPSGATNHGPVFALYNTVAYTDSTNKTMGVIPANANIIEINLFLSTLFNDSGTDFIDCGTTAGNPVEYLNANDVSSGVGVFRIGSGGAAVSTIGDVGASNVTVLCKYRGANTNATAGAATLVILYMID